MKKFLLIFTLSILLPIKFYAFFPRLHIGIFEVVAFFKNIMSKKGNYAASLTTTSSSNQTQTTPDQSLPSIVPTFSPEEEKFINHNLGLLEKMWAEKKKNIEKKREIAEKYDLQSDFEHECTALFERIRVHKDWHEKTYRQTLDFISIDKKNILQNVYKNMLHFLLAIKDNPKTNKQHRENAQKAYAILISDNPDAEKVENLMWDIVLSNSKIQDTTLPKYDIHQYLGINYTFQHIFYNSSFVPYYLESKFFHYCYQEGIFAFIKEQKVKKGEIRPADTISLPKISSTETQKTQTNEALALSVPNASPEEEKFITYNTDLLEQAWLEKKQNIEKKREIAEKYDVRSDFEHDCSDLFDKVFTGKDENVLRFLGTDKKEFLRNLYKDMVNFLIPIKDDQWADKQHRENAKKAYAILMSDKPNAQEVEDIIFKIKNDNYEIKDKTIADYLSKEPYPKQYSPYQFRYLEPYINYFKFLEYCQEQGVFAFLKEQKVKKGEIAPRV